MKKNAKLILCLVLVLSSILCLAACGSNGDNNSVVGKYTIYSMDSNGMTLTGEELEAILVLGGASADDMYIELKEDGTGYMSVMGQNSEMEYKDGQIWPVDQPDEKVSFTVKDGMLTLTQDGNEMVFKKK